MSWTEQKGQRYEDLHKRRARLTDTERAELAELTRDLEGVESAFANEDVQRKLKRGRQAPEVNAPKQLRPWLLQWLWPVPVGLIFGLAFLAPLARGPGDPSGHSIGAALGGALGLVMSLFWRMLLRK